MPFKHAYIAVMILPPYEIIDISYSDDHADGDIEQIARELETDVEWGLTHLKHGVDYNIIHTTGEEAAKLDIGENYDLH